MEAGICPASDSGNIGTFGGGGGGGVSVFVSGGVGLSGVLLST